MSLRLFKNIFSIAPVASRDAVKMGRACTMVRGSANKFFSSESTTSSDPTAELEGLKKSLKEREGQLAELKDSYLRALADMENLRQRAKRDQEAASHFAIQKFSKDIVSVADILEMALKAVPQREAEGDAPATPVPTADAPKQLADLIEGLQMTLGELHKVFGRHGVSVIDPMHQKFNPNEHNALYEIPDGQVEPGTVVAVQKKGYMLNHRVIRPADVGVSRKP